MRGAPKASERVMVELGLTRTACRLAYKGERGGRVVVMSKCDQPPNNGFDFECHSEIIEIS